MGGETEPYTCDRCGIEFPISEYHTEIVRRDFVETTHPTRIERFCVDCWKAYVEEFLGREFDAVLEGYESSDG